MSERPVVLLDSCVLINLMLACRTDLLHNLGCLDFRITPEVKNEIRQVEQHRELDRLTLKGFAAYEFRG